MNTKNDILRLEQEFKDCQKALIAIGDETSLSRPTVSHHMQILKDAGFVKVGKEGTKYYYYPDMDDNEIERLCRLFEDVRAILKNVPDRRGEEP